MRPPLDSKQKEISFGVEKYSESELLSRVLAISEPAAPQGTPIVNRPNDSLSRHVREWPVESA